MNTDSVTVLKIVELLMFAERGEYAEAVLALWNQLQRERGMPHGWVDPEVELPPYGLEVLIDFGDTPRFARRLDRHISEPGQEWFLIQLLNGATEWELKPRWMYIPPIPEKLLEKSP